MHHCMLGLETFACLKGGNFRRNLNKMFSKILDKILISSNGQTS